jgi:hypothetical protein
MPGPSEAGSTDHDPMARYEAPAIEASEPVYSLIIGITVVSGA